MDKVEYVYIYIYIYIYILNCTLETHRISLSNVAVIKTNKQTNKNFKKENSYEPQIPLPNLPSQATIPSLPYRRFVIR